MAPVSFALRSIKSPHVPRKTWGLITPCAYPAANFSARALETPIVEADDPSPWGNKENRGQK